jgi:hypothetical protein
MKRHSFSFRHWVKIALVNFLVVALAGIIMRFKINFSLPFVNQKYFLHAHSHFAFTGWVTLALMVLMVNYLRKQNISANYKIYNRILLANCLSAYGMLISFIVQGYAIFSITFSTLSIFISYLFIFNFWRDLNKAKDKSYASTWFKAAMVLWAISSLGAFSLAYLMANRIMVQDYYFAAIYFFLHFQYNGWFLFTCFGLLFSYLSKKDTLPSIVTNKKLFIIMAVTVGPAYFLSVLWMKLPAALHLTADIAGILQLLVLIYFVKLLPFVKKNIPSNFSKSTGYLWSMVFIAFIIKIILQMLSIVPFLSSYAFGFRPIVIGYLHLSFLGIISFFIIGYFNQELSERERPISKMGLFIFVTGVLVQEIILMCQGLEVIEFKPLPYANMILFYTSITMGIGLIWISLSVIRNERVCRIPQT